jgi:hypothetical protein
MICSRSTQTPGWTVDRVLTESDARSISDTSLRSRVGGCSSGRWPRKAVGESRSDRRALVYPGALAGWSASRCPQIELVGEVDPTRLAPVGEVARDLRKRLTQSGSRAP